MARTFLEDNAPRRAGQCEGRRAANPRRDRIQRCFQLGLGYLVAQKGRPVPQPFSFLVLFSPFFPGFVVVFQFDPLRVKLLAGDLKTAQFNRRLLVASLPCSPLWVG